MGHLTRIANAVVQNLERGPMQTPVSEVIQGECLWVAGALFQMLLPEAVLPLPPALCPPAPQLAVTALEPRQEGSPSRLGSPVG